MSKINNTVGAVQGLSGFTSLFPLSTKGNLVLGANYTLTASLAATGLELTLANKGFYEIYAQVFEDITNITTTNGTYSLYQLYEGTSAWTAVANTERLGLYVPTLAAAVVGINKVTTKLFWQYENTIDNNVLKIYGKTNIAMGSGSWVVTTGATGRSTMNSLFIG